MSWFPRSLRNRLVAIATLTTFVVMTGAAAVATWQIRTITDRALSDAARTRLAAVQDGLTPAGQLPSSRVVQRTATYVQVLAADGRVVSASPALSDAQPLLPITVARRGVHHPKLLNLNQPDLDLAVIAEPVSVSGGRGAVIVGVDSQGFLDARAQLRTVVLLGVPLVVVLTGLLTWLITGRAFRAMTRLAEDADALSVADTGRGLSVHTGDIELGRLVAALNRMLGRLNQHYATNLAAAAETTHRLRTPLATLRAEAELALLDDDPAAARVALERIVADADRLTGIVDRLLAAAGGHRDVRDLRAAVTEVGGEWQRQAAAHARRATVHCTGSGHVDVTLLRAVIDPLVENAIRHTTADRPVAVTVDGTDSQVRIRVSNQGAGVPAALRDQLFQPWTGRAHGGLGLWLAREAARSAGGDVVCETYGPPTTTFLARLPATPADTTSAPSQAAHR
jgi:signal transduction histidine kinase